MFTKFVARTTILAGLAGLFAGASIVFAQTNAVEPAGEISGKAISTKTSETATQETGSKPDSVLDAPVMGIHKSNDDAAAVSRKSVPMVVGYGRFTIADETAADARPAIDDSKSQKSPRAKQNSTGSEWEIAFAPYLFTSGISGTVGARGRVLEVDASFGNVFENLDVGVMGTLEARKNKLVFVSDLIWTKLSAERDTPGGLYSTAKVGVNLFIFDPEVGYRVAESKAGSFDVLGGVRIWSVENNLNLTTGTLPGFDVSQRKTWAAPVVGFHGLLNLSPKFYLSTKFDIGGAGIGADLTTQFYGGAGYRVTPKIALIGGYRFLQVDYDDSSGFLFDTKMNGFVFGAKFNF